MTTVGNGPDRSLGLWQTAGGQRVVYSVRDGCLLAEGYGQQPYTRRPFVAELLGFDARPFDTTAKREAIRAGWREVGGKWEVDERHPDGCNCCGIWGVPGPTCYELSAKDRGEWPQDEPQAEAPTPKPAKAPTAYRAAKAALREACDEARQQGREGERRAQAARPCVLKRLEGVGREAFAKDFSDEGTAAHLLLTVVEYAKTKGVDLSALAERLASGVEVKP